MSFFDVMQTVIIVMGIACLALEVWGTYRKRGK